MLVQDSKIKDFSKFTKVLSIDQPDIRYRVVIRSKNALATIITMSNGGDLLEPVRRCSNELDVEVVLSSNLSLALLFVDP